MNCRAIPFFPFGCVSLILAFCLLVIACLPTPGMAYMSVEEEKELGDKLAQQLQQNLEVIDDPLTRGYVDKIGRRLLEEARDHRFPYHFYVIKEREPNAFAIPGGHIFVSSGLIRLVDEEDELAGVIGHEIGHSVLRHIAKAMERAKRISLATLAAIIAGAFLSQDAKGTGALATSAMAMAQSLMLKYTRENEVEADQKGTTYMMGAGYDPRAMVIFLKKIYRWQRYVSPNIPTYLSTHPGVDFRITYLSDIFLSAPKPPSPHPAAAGDLKKIQIRLFIKERGAVAGIDRFSSLLRERPGDVNTLYGLGVSYVMAGRAKEAIPILVAALKASPKNGYIMRELGIAYFQAKEVGRALQTLQSTLNSFPHDTTILYYLAQGHQEEGRWDQSLSLYRRVLELDPQKVEIYHNLGVIYSMKGLLGPAHKNFGLYFKEKGERETALFHFRKAWRYYQDEDEKRQLEDLIRECER
ncbi:MAG: M48 family metalloprotease [Deltaproteobacteria bacterium]|nr:M48 family metalloprotease [Deltaproteobacteria bacterium]